MSRTSAGFTERKGLTVFFSYAHADEEYRNELENHLGFLKSSALLETWHDRKIMPGEEWEDKIDEQMNFADIILLLISPDFAGSSFCRDVEMTRAFRQSLPRSL